MNERERKKRMENIFQIKQNKNEPSKKGGQEKKIHRLFASKRSAYLVFIIKSLLFHWNFLPFFCSYLVFIHNHNV